MITQEQTDTIQLTDSAAEMVRNLLIQKDVPDHGLRIFVSGGGCSGLQYGMALDADAGENDQIIERNGVRIFVDSVSMMYLTGAVVDYEDNLMGGGFRIDNPNAVSSCGCGHSFKTSGSADSNAGAGYNGGGGCGCG
ncbi:MAG: iron-sulfur cluster insertion protein ErpA [Deltaproteobacteria bacterium]|nr:iron-sulfur cluster insertion protein ErpA [Deltaproteobacteria bacterium]